MQTVSQAGSAEQGEVTKLENLSQLLKELPRKLEHEVMIPLGSYAFIPGQVTRTNEVLVERGNWTTSNKTPSSPSSQHQHQRMSAYEARKGVLSKLKELKTLISSNKTTECSYETFDDDMQKETNKSRKTHKQQSKQNFSSITKSKPAQHKPINVKKTNVDRTDIDSSTIVHKNKDGIVHILEFPSDEDDEQPEKNTSTNGGPGITLEQCNTEEEEECREKAIKTRNVQNWPRQPGQPRAELQYNENGTITIMEFPDEIEESKNDKEIDNMRFHNEKPKNKNAEVAIDEKQSESSKCYKDRCIALVTACRMQGNHYFQQMKYTLAVEQYSLCIDTISNVTISSIPTTKTTKASEIQIDLRKQLPIILTNRAAAYVALKKFKQAVVDATDALEKNPRHAKAYHRLAQAQVGQENFEGALFTYEKAIAMHPQQNTFFQKHIAKIQAKIRRTEVAEIDKGSTNMGPGMPVQILPIVERTATSAQTAPSQSHMRVKQRSNMPTTRSAKKSLFRQRMHAR